jgi:flagellar motor switch protein FliN
MANDPVMSQDEIERLFSQTKDPIAAAQGPAAGGAAAGPLTPPIGAGDSGLPSQDDIDALLQEAGRGAAAPLEQTAPAKEPPAGLLPGEGDITPRDIEYLLNQAEQALESVDSGREGDLPPGVTSFRLEEFSGSPATTEAATLELIRDVELDLTIELGRTHMYLEDVLKLRRGSVVPLDKLAGDPVDIYVNERLVARGEVLVLNDNFCVRVAELIVGANVFA